MDRVAMPRFAAPADVMPLARLRWLSRDADERAREGPDEFSRRFGPWLTGALASGMWHVAVAAGEESGVVGCIYLQCIGTVPVPGILTRRWGHLTHAFVESSCRNRGLGRAMLELLVARARELELLELHVWPSTQAISLYSRAGFLTPEQRRALPDPAEPSYVLPLG
jgi:ribosomal protein S18 acetylase RimI-like enzyme